MNYKVKIITSNKNFTIETLDEILNKEYKFTKFSKFGYSEPLKHKIFKNCSAKAIELFNTYENIIIKGTKKFYLSNMRFPNGISIWNIDFTDKNISTTTINEVIDLMESFAKNSQLLFAHFSTEAEFDIKHKEIDDCSVGWEGVSVWDYENFLPGVYWYTLFGSELVNTLGEHKLTNIPNVNYVKTPNNCISFHLKEPINSDNWKQRQKSLDDLGYLIHPNLFYKKGIDKSNLNHLKAYKTYLKALK